MEKELLWITWVYFALTFCRIRERTSLVPLMCCGGMYPGRCAWSVLENQALPGPGHCVLGSGTLNSRFFAVQCAWM